MPPRQIVYTVVLIALVATVLLRGGKWEWAGAAAMIVASAINPFAQDRPNWLEPQYGILMLDAALFLALTLIALRSDRWWPILSAGFQLLGLMIHLGMIMDSALLPHAYYRGLSIYSYMVILPLLLAPWLRPRRPKPS